MRLRRQYPLFSPTEIVLALDAAGDEIVDGNLEAAATDETFDDRRKLAGVFPATVAAAGEAHLGTAADKLSP